MSGLVLIDTDILIDVGRNVKNAVAFLQQQQSQAGLAISTVTQMELIVGCQNKPELRALEQFLQRFQIIKLNEQISDMAVEILRRYRLSHGLLIADALIAATSLSLHQPMATKNRRDYQFINDLQLIPYP